MTGLLVAVTSLCTHLADPLIRVLALYTQLTDFLETDFYNLLTGLLILFIALYTLLTDLIIMETTLLLRFRGLWIIVTAFDSRSTGLMFK